MKKRHLFILTALVLVIPVSILLWKFVPSYRVYTLTGIVALVVIGMSWLVLHFIPKRQAAAVARARDATIKPTDLFQVENEARRTLAQIVGGFLVIVGSGLTVVSLIITQKEAEKNRISTQREAEKNRSLELEGQITDRFTKAITQLDGKNAIEVRLGGIYALERIAKDSDIDHWTIMEVLTAYVREHTSKKKQDNVRKPSSNKTAKDTNQEIFPKLPTDIQAILTVIGRRKIPSNVEEGIIDLSFAILPHAALYRANLRKAALGYANLRGASFYQANLREAFLDQANLSLAYLSRADLSGAQLSGADLREANLIGANLIGADLDGAHFNGALLIEANFSGATLSLAYLTGADLSEAKNLSWDQVSEAFVDDQTTLPPEMENQHKSELKAMREKTKKEQQGK